MATTAPAPQAAAAEEEPPPLLASIVIVAWDCEASLRECLGALELSEHRERIEVIVVDAGSDDGCANIDSEFPNIVLLRLARNFGLTRSRNIGIRTAKSDFICFLSPSVLVRPATIARLSLKLEADSSAGAVSALLFEDDGQGGRRLAPLCYQLPSRADLWEAWKQARGQRLSPPETSSGDDVAEGVAAEALLIRKSFLKGMNYLDERYAQYWSDVEVCYQMKNAAKRIIIAADAPADISPTPLPSPSLGSDRGLLSADRGNGASHYVARRAGAFAGLTFRLRLILAAFQRLLRFKDFSFAWAQFSGLLSGSKLDGSQ